MSDSIFTRCEANPLIAPQDLTPSDPRLRVRGSFNPAVAHDGEQFVMLVRVAEDAAPGGADAAVPVVTIENGKAGLSILEFSKDEPDVDLSDSRCVSKGDRLYLTTLSHLRLATSRDGIHFDMRPEPFLYAEKDYEAYGIEDARLARIDGRWYINYTVVGPDSFCTALATSDDLRSVEKRGILFAPENKDVCIFPEKVGGMYHTLHRPLNSTFGGRHGIWYAQSPDLIHWGGHQAVIRPRANGYENHRVGGGGPSIRTPEGWLQIYHGANHRHQYHLFAALFDLEQPWKLIARGERPVLSPEAEYETNGFFGGVVFSSGAVLLGDTIYLYYGAADETTCLATAPLDAVLGELKRARP